MRRRPDGVALILTCANPLEDTLRQLASCVAPPVGISLATGAFRTSCLEILCVESGEPPLSLHRVLLFSYVSKLATQLEQRTRTAVSSHLP